MTDDLLEPLALTVEPLAVAAVVDEPLSVSVAEAVVADAVCVLVAVMLPVPVDVGVIVAVGVGGNARSHVSSKHDWQ